MLRGLGNLVSKEIRELLRDKKILMSMVIVPLILFPMMGIAMRASATSIQESLKSTGVAVADLDKATFSLSLLQALRSYPGVKVTEVNASTLNDALNRVSGMDVMAALVIPEGFSENLTRGLRGRLEVYSILRSMSVAETSGSAALGSLIAVFDKALAAQTIAKALPGRDPSTVMNPVMLSEKSVVKGRTFDIPGGAILGVVVMQSAMMPAMIMILLISAMQIAATSIAMEKEEKTLETFLTLPVGRLTILAGKLAGSVLVAAVGAIAYLIGFMYYTESMTGFAREGQGAGVDLAALGLAPPPQGYLLLGASLFMSLVAALALALSVAVFSEDVRSAQSMVGFITIPIILPAIFLVIGDINALPIGFRLLLYAIPFTHPVLAGKAVFMGDYATIAWGIGYVALFTLAVLYVAARLFTTDKIVTARGPTGRWGLRRRRALEGQE